jgi:hypothetical protein
MVNQNIEHEHNKNRVLIHNQVIYLRRETIVNGMNFFHLGIKYLDSLEIYHSKH